MRPALVLGLAALLAGCASQPGHPGERGPGGYGHGHPGGAGGPNRGEAGGRGFLFISPFGEPFRGDRQDRPARAWFDGADTNHDGRLTLAEFNADAMRWFAVLDRGHDGEIDPDDIEYYENILAPEIRTGGGGDGQGPRGPRGGGQRRGGGGGGRHGGMGGGGMGGGGMGGRGSRGGGGSSGEQASSAPSEPARQGAARYGYLDYPEPITAMDRNLNRGIDQMEMAAAAADRFKLLDRNGDGVIEWSELPHIAAPPAGFGQRSGMRPPPTPREAEEEPDRGD